MFTTRRTVRIEWGDCDPAGIVFYPNYFAMFDHSTVLLIERALGMKKDALYRHYGFGGYPSVEAKARFILPTRYGDDVEIQTEITKLGRSSFSLQHRLSLDGALAVEGHETRVWVVRDPSRPGGFRAHPMPEDVLARFGATVLA
jgi:4-hydroxybenzoyl-CoA thioesterase